MTKENIRQLYWYYKDAGQEANRLDIEATDTFKDNKEYVLKEDKPAPPAPKKEETKKS